MWVRSLGQKDALEEEVATHSSILAWTVPCTEEREGLQSYRVTKSQTRLSTHSCTQLWERLNHASIRRANVIRKAMIYQRG